MAFDQSTRNRLARFVSDARRILTDEFTRQCKQDYGIDPDTGEVSDIARLTHLNDTQRATARILRETLDHYVAGSPSGGKNTSIDRIIREQAFTTLNRLCAVRMAEARGIVIESVGKGPQSKGFALYARVAGSALGETADAYRCYLFSIFDEIALDLPPLFDRFSPKGRLFPSATALDSLLTEINHVDLDPLWGEDETIGWLYQYFNSIEERKQMRDESAAPRNSRELAVRNQFFTPRYVVEFLTDNTLGRIWYEMTKGETALKDTCRYLVRRPSEIFLAEGQEAPAQDQSTENLSQEEMLRQPVHSPHRPLKDPREIRLLDPACGSMHFGLYAFDLFTTIYDEAWELARGPASTRPQSPAFANFIAFAATFKDRAAFLREVPRLIIEHNIHGIDIDPRAVQIAGLSLWLRAQRAWHQAGVKPTERPRITRSHIVCAEPMPGEKALLQEFVQQQFQENERPVFGYLLEQVFDQMKLAGEAGSLLRIEESIRTSIAEAKRRWKEGPKYEQSPLFPEAIAKPGQGQMRLDLSGITDEQFWERAEQRIYDALKAYSEKAENGGGFQRRLFAEDASRGFALVDVCRKRYDGVLMNPPFGESCGGAAARYSRDTYPTSYSNMAAVFIERGVQVLLPRGRLGYIADKSLAVRSTYEDWRRSSILSHSLEVFLDLGWGVLDTANVETHCMVLDKIAAHNAHRAHFVDLQNEKDKEPQLLRSCSGGMLSREQRRFLATPNATFIYHLPESVLRLFECSPLDPTWAAVRIGSSPGDAYRFYRYSWERSDGADTWMPVWNGGEYSPFYRPALFVIKWASGGAEMMSMHDASGAPTAFPRNLGYYGKPGLNYGKRNHLLNPHVMNAGCGFTDEGQGIFPTTIDDSWWLLSYLNTRVARSLVNTYCGQHKHSGYVRMIPVPDLSPADKAALGSHARDAHDALGGLWRHVMEHGQYAGPWDALPPSIGHLADQYRQLGESARRTLSRVEDAIDRIAVKACGLSEAEAASLCGAIAQMGAFDSGIAARVAADTDGDLSARQLIDHLVGCAFGRWDVEQLRKPVLPQATDPLAPLPAYPPARLLSDEGSPPRAQQEMPSTYPIQLPWSGVLVDDPSEQWDLVKCFEQVIEAVWGSAAESIERELCEVLRERSLREYFQRPQGFFADHLSRYSPSRREAPIYWPLSTTSGAYTLWLYFPTLSEQTLYSCVNDFVDPKLARTAEIGGRLRQKAGRNATEEKELARVSELETELRELRDVLLGVATRWRPHCDDGVQITASPLWKLIRHKPWQKKLKETWEALEAGEYDWSHLAYSLWPERVREKCKRDKSLAIAHGLQELYQEPPAAAGKKRGRKPKVADPELMEDAE